MKKRFLTMFGVALLSLQLTQSSLHAKILNSDTTIPNATLPVTLLTAAGLYAGYNYIIRQDFLVEHKHPMAYAWYQTMQVKYPGVLDDIYFIQTPDGSMIPDFLAKCAKQCNWLRHNNRIYFASNDLAKISLVYNKIVDGYPLHKNEELMLACYEFILLHEAGYLAHQDDYTLLALLGGIFGIQTAYDTWTGSGKKQEGQQPAPSTPNETAKENEAAKENKEKKDKNILAGYELPELKSIIGKSAADTTKTLLDALGFTTKIPGILSTAQGLTFVAGIIALLRHQEHCADQFACSKAETKTLQQALILFENDETDILHELETKTVMPYIPANSPAESTLQQIAQPAEYVALYGAQQFYLLFKKTAPTRWFFDFTQNALHQGPSVRAQIMHDELERRQA